MHSKALLTKPVLKETAEYPIAKFKDFEGLGLVSPNNNCLSQGQAFSSLSNNLVWSDIGKEYI